MQSILAVAGAGLVAVSAIVFLFFDPDLTGGATRNVVIAAITVLLLGGAWLSARRALRFSAEAVGTLGVVFVALDVQALAASSTGTMGAWIAASVATLVAGIGLGAAALATGLRAWSLAAVLAIVIAPSMLGYAGTSPLAATIGHLATAAAASAMTRATLTVVRRTGQRRRAETFALTSVQALAITATLLALPSILAGSATAGWSTGWGIVAALVAAIAAISLASGRHPGGVVWLWMAGAGATAAVSLLPLAVDLLAPDDPAWYLAVLPGAAALGLLVVVVCPIPRTLEHRVVNLGAFCTVLVAVIPPAGMALFIGSVAVVAAMLESVGAAVIGSGAASGLGGAGPVGIPTVTGLGAMALGLVTASAMRATPAIGLRRISAWVISLAALTVICLPDQMFWVQLTIGLGLAVATSSALTFLSRRDASPVVVRVPFTVGIHLAILLVAVLSWREQPDLVAAGPLVVLATAVAARTVPPGFRYLHVGAGYAYSLVVVAVALSGLGVASIAVQCLTTAIGLVGAIVATVTRPIGPRSWLAIMAVSSIPFVAGIAQVVVERSGWTALSTGLMFLLSLTLVLGRRRTLSVGLRAMAAAALVPSAAVVVVCLGAEVLSASASPVTLPIIASIVAAVLATIGPIRRLLSRGSVPDRDAAIAGVAVEASALLTATIAVGLALGREAAGLDTTAIVLVILGIGSAMMASATGRRYGWWLAAAALTGALWCGWAILGLATLELYLIPPSLGLTVVGVVLTARGGRATALYGVGLAGLVAPTLVTLSMPGLAATLDGMASMPWRAGALLVASWVLVAGGILLRQRTSAEWRRLRVLRSATLIASVAAAAAGPVQGLRWGQDIDPVIGGAVPVVLSCFAVGMLGALPSALAARDIIAAHKKSGVGSGRWATVVAPTYVALATWTAIDRDWFTIWAMWTLMLALLAIMLVPALRPRYSRVLPPVWFAFGLAFVTSIVAWSPRELRVEWFSAPLGIALLIAGAVILRRDPDGKAPARVSLGRWPEGFTGSWALLGPGLAVITFASVLATFTDPQTWRAVLVMIIALLAILVGGRLRLAAPFIVGIVVLPVENVVVFAVQIGRGIQSMPWWITLAVVGAVLLILAVTYERRAGDTSLTARLRDLA